MTDRSSSRGTIAREVAEALGVSISTVSRAFSPKATIAERTRRRVLAKAAELGYRPNLHARSLKTNQSRIVAIVVSDLGNPFYPEVLGRLCEAIEGAGFSVMLFCRRDTQTLDEALRAAFRYQPDVLLTLAVTMSSAAIDAAINAGIAVVLFNRYVPGNASTAITCDNDAGGEAVADLFVACGLSRLAFVAGDSDATTNRDRQIGFSRAVRRHGLPPPTVFQGGRFSHEAGLQAGRLLCTRHVGQIDAVFCANDVLALGVLDALREQHLVAGRDMSVVGFDDIAMASWASYQLTTYRQPVDEMIAASVDAINEVTAGGAIAGTRISIPGQIVSRRTVYPAPSDD